MSTPYNTWPLGYGEPSLPEGASMEAQITSTSGTNVTATTAGPTEYVILVRDEAPGSGYWRERNEGTVTARSRGAAVEIAIGEPKKDTDGVYIAVPLRSWKPIRAKAKVETTLALEDA